MSFKEKKTLKRNSLRNSKTEDDVKLPLTSIKDPSAPTTSKDEPTIVEAKSAEPPKKPCWTRCWNYMYDQEKQLYCGRSCSSWLYMIIYSIMYLIFLSTYTMIFLYGTLMIIKMSESYLVLDKSGLMEFTENGIGLSAVPTSLDHAPLISYRNGHLEEYSKYIKSLDELLIKRRKRHVGSFTDLGPCGSAPYGYGDKPCIIIRLNKQLRWSAKPYKANSTEHLPEELKQWLRLKEQKLWLHCSGYLPYDKEHIGSLKYYPYPPGFEPSVFPLDMRSDTPLIAIQISNFTLGLSLTVECNLWYNTTVSSVSFLLYVEPKNRSVTFKNI